MSKLKMKQIWICLLKKDVKTVSNILQMAGVVDLTSVDKEKAENMDSKMVANKTMYTKYVKTCDDAIEILNKYNDKKEGLLSSFEGPKVISIEKIAEKAKHRKQIVEDADKIINRTKEISEAKAQIIKCENRIAQLDLWKNLDIKLNYKGTERARSFIGTIKGMQTNDSIYQSMAEGLDEEAIKYLDITVLNASKEETSFIVFTLNEYANAVEEQLKKIEFVNAPLTKYIPQEEINNIENDIKELNKKISQCEKDIIYNVNNIEYIKITRDYYAIMVDKLTAQEKVLVTDSTYILTGYIPEIYVKSLVDKLNSKVDAYIEVTEPEADDEVPIALKNGFYAEPMETVVESYSLPNKDEFDPSKVLSIFYYVLFGLMLSDAGYGLLLVLGTGFILAKVKNIKPEMKKMMKLFFFGGIFTIIWGLLFGSFFGNAVDVIAQYIRGTENIEPVFVPFLKKIHIYWFNPVDDPMRLLVFAFAIGIIHLFTGLFIKGLLLIKQKAYKDFVYDVLFWALFVGGGIVYLLTMEMVTGMIGMEKPLGATVATVSAIVMGIGCLGVVLTSGRESKNWFKRLLKGAYGAYGITGWLSDILSYSRLLALGLATGIIAEVFNTMGSMVKIPFLGLIIFILVFIVGHTLNLGINVMGAYVHTNRLQFVEFFGKFYSGGGTKYAPFKENTKYYIIKED